jgi:hypothetical protein
LTTLGGSQWFTYQKNLPLLERLVKTLLQGENIATCEGRFWTGIAGRDYRMKSRLMIEIRQPTIVG